jgi:hypothetical protein
VTRGSAPKGASAIGSATNQDERYTEVRRIVVALERLVCHAVVCGDVFALDELGDHIVEMLARADRHLEVAGVAP